MTVTIARTPMTDYAPICPYCQREIHRQCTVMTPKGPRLVDAACFRLIMTLQRMEKDAIVEIR